MLRFLNSFLQENKEQITPFTTQIEVLEKYNQGINDDGEMVGMCRPMSNAYVDLILKGKKPQEYLANDKKFLKLAIEEENRELASGDLDVDHFAFKENNIPHSDITIAKSDLTEEKFNSLLEDNKHLLITFPQKKFDHEVYFGKKEKAGSCRFFDANLPGGERKGQCRTLIPELIGMMKSQYTEEEEPFHIGMSKN